MKATDRRAFAAAVVLAGIAGAALRLAWPGAFQYLGDEAWTFDHVQSARNGGGLEPLGMPSSQGIRNPGMSLWVFAALGVLGRVATPADLTRMVALCGIVANLGLVLVALRIAEERERRTWLWAFVLASTNPILVFMERKIWAQSVLPIFDVVLLIAWMRRETRAGAFVWGLLGAVVGQIHMAGFFFAPALAGWTAAAERWKGARRSRWIAWVLGSAAGGAAGLGWLLYLAHDRPAGAHSSFWLRFRLEFYQYFFSDPASLSSSYFFGDELGDTMKWPLVGGAPTWLVGIGHVLAGVASLALAVTALLYLWRHRDGLRALAFGDGSDTSLLLGAVLVAMGVAITLPSIPIHRHYMMVLFPAPYLFYARVARTSRRGDLWLGLLAGAGALITFGLLAFVHANGGGREFGPTWESTLGGAR